MREHILLPLVLFFNLTYAQTYCAGDQISSAHQNQQFNVCYGSGEYATGDSWSLADYNGALNGGDYNILFIDMGATW